MKRLFSMAIVAMILLVSCNRVDDIDIDYPADIDGIWVETIAGGADEFDVIQVRGEDATLSHLRKEAGSPCYITYQRAGAFQYSSATGDATFQLADHCPHV